MFQFLLLEERQCGSILTLSKANSGRLYKQKVQRKARSSSSNVVSISIRETEEDVTPLISTEEEESAFIADTGAPPTSKTQSGKQYLKQYDEPMVNFPQSAEETIE